MRNNKLIRPRPTREGEHNALLMLWGLVRATYRFFTEAGIALSPLLGNALNTGAMEVWVLVSTAHVPLGFSIALRAAAG